MTYRLFRKIFVIILFGVVGVLCDIQAGAAQSPLKLVNDPWPPYTGDALPQKGLATEIVVTALQRSGYQTQVEFVPWKRALQGTVDGTYDVLLTTSYSADRARTVAYSDPYLVNIVKLIKHREAPHVFETLQDLTGLDMVIIDGYLYEPHFDAASNFTKSIGVNTLSNLRMLALNRVDLMAEEEQVARYYLKNNEAFKDLKVEFLPQPLNTKQMHIIIRKSRPDHTKIIEDFNRSLDQMRVDGTYQEIIVRHVGRVPVS